MPAGLAQTAMMAGKMCSSVITQFSQTTIALFRMVVNMFSHILRNNLRWSCQGGGAVRQEVLRARRTRSRGEGRETGVAGEPLPIC